MVLRTMVKAYVGEAQPIGSKSLSHVLPMKLSSASVRTILSELAGLGLVEKPYSSSGRIPTERGLRFFVDQLLEADAGGRRNLGSYEMRSIAHSVDGAETDSVVNVASQLLSESTHQLGFVVSPSVEQVVLRQVNLVRLSTERVLVESIRDRLRRPHNRSTQPQSRPDMRAVRAGIHGPRRYFRPGPRWYRP